MSLLREVFIELFFYTSMLLLEDVYSMSLSTSLRRAGLLIQDLGTSSNLTLQKDFNISVNESDFERFMQTAFEIVRNGNKADWGILTGTSFAMTSLTTIGK